jgi:hypothetical protein
MRSRPLRPRLRTRLYRLVGYGSFASVRMAQDDAEITVLTARPFEILS